MTNHDLAMLALDEALKQARETVAHILGARQLAAGKNYSRARAAISEAVTPASFVDQVRLPSAAAALEACK